jgi:S-adenosyl-L-methionine hydrolase (adenosine-forming)
MLITLTTDFGYQDSFVGIMKGVIHAINPDAHVIDLTHGVPPQNVMAGALILQHSIRYFPPGTIHVVVVDPGVGSQRRPILIEFDGSYYIGPDNGVLSVAFERKQPSRITLLSNKAFQLHPTSNTFHAREIFAPVAAHLSLGVPPSEFGEKLDAFVELIIPKLTHRELRIEGEIIYMDSFGNLFTNVRERDLTGLPRDLLRISLGPVEVGGLSRNYANVSAGEFACVFNSWGLLEIALNKGNARQRTGAKVGDKISVDVKQVSSKDVA